MPVRKKQSSENIYEDVMEQEPHIVEFTIEDCDRKMAGIDTVISNLQAEKSVWAKRKTDANAYKQGGDI